MFAPLQRSGLSGSARRAKRAKRPTHTGGSCACHRTPPTREQRRADQSPWKMCRGGRVGSGSTTATRPSPWSHISLPQHPPLSGSARCCRWRPSRQSGRSARSSPDVQVVRGTSHAPNRRRRGHPYFRRRFSARGSHPVMLMLKQASRIRAATAASESGGSQGGPGPPRRRSYEFRLLAR